MLNQEEKNGQKYVGLKHALSASVFDEKCSKAS